MIIHYIKNKDGSVDLPNKGKNFGSFDEMEAFYGNSDDVEFVRN